MTVSVAPSRFHDTAGLSARAFATGDGYSRDMIPNVSS
jgi:hypothetical protein